MLPISRNFQVLREGASGDTLVGVMSLGRRPVGLSWGRCAWPMGRVRGLEALEVLAGPGFPAPLLSRQRRFSWFLLQMLLLGVVGAAVGRVAGSGGDSLGFRGLLLSSSSPLYSQCGRG